MMMDEILRYASTGVHPWPMAAKGSFGARNVHKHVWHLPIPEFDPADPLHAELEQAGVAIRRKCGK